MRIIPTWLHGMLDYPMGLLLIVLPWLFGFANNGPAMWIPIIAGIAIIGVSAFTAYEAGLVRSIPMTGHLAADIGLGIFLAASPWLFGFADMVFWPHLILGIAEAGAGLMTQTEPGHRLSRTAM